MENTNKMVIADITEIASATGINTETLNSLSDETKFNISVAFAYDSTDIKEIYAIVNDELNNITLIEVAEFMHTDFEKLKEFDSEVQNHLVGIFSMEYDITADEELRSNLFSVIEEGVIWLIQGTLIIRK